MTHARHIALLVPANNTTMAREMPRWMGDGTRFTTLLIPRGQGMLSSATLPAYCDQAVALARSLAGGDVDVLAYGCTAAGFMLGPAGDADVARRLAQASGKPVATTASSMVGALRQQGATRIALLTPYQDDVNIRLRAFLAHYDIETVAFDSFYAADVHALGRITEAQVEAKARELGAGQDCDALFIACSQLPTREILDTLSQALGIPVLSSISATARQAQALLAGQAVANSALA